MQIEELSGAIIGNYPFNKIKDYIDNIDRSQLLKKGENDFTLLQLALLKDNTEVVTYLLKKQPIEKWSEISNTNLLNFYSVFSKIDSEKVVSELLDVNSLEDLKSLRESLSALINRKALISIKKIIETYSRNLILDKENFISLIETLSLTKEHNVLTLFLNEKDEKTVNWVLDNYLKDYPFDKFGKEGPPLYFAVLNFNRKIIEKMLNRKSEINQSWTVKDVKNNTVLLMACKNSRNYENIRLLVEKGANLTIENSKGENPVSFAMKKEDDKLMRIFLDNNLNVNFTLYDKKEVSLLRYAILQHKSEEITKLLIKSEAELKEIENEPSLFLTICIKEWHTVLEELFKNKTYNYIPDENEIIEIIKSVNSYKVLLRLFKHYGIEPFLSNCKSYEEVKKILNVGFTIPLNNGDFWKRIPYQVLKWVMDYLKEWRDYCQSPESEKSEVHFIGNLLGVVSKNKQDICVEIKMFLDEYMNIIDRNLNLNLCSNLEDLPKSGFFGKIDKKKIYQYKKSTGGDRFCITEDVMDDLIEKSIDYPIDPYEKDSLYNLKSFPHEISLFSDYKIRKMAGKPIVKKYHF